MGRIFFIEGSRAVGKSTLLRKIKEKFPNAIIREGYTRKDYNFDLSNYDEFILNQRLYIDCEIAEYKLFKKQPNDVFIVKGIPTVEYFTKRTSELKGFYDRAIVELNDDLNKLSKYKGDKTIFLDCSKENIIARYNNDPRKRKTMDIWLNSYFDSYRDFFINREGVEIIDANYSNADEIFNQVLEIIEK